MQKSNLRIPVGLLFVLMIGLIGFKDTGIFVSSFNAKLNNGVEVDFDSNDRVEIIGEGASETTYFVDDGENEFYVQKAKLLKVDNGVKGYTVVKNTPLYDSYGGVTRLLFLDEYLTFLENNNEMALVRTNDGLEGYVRKADLDPDRIRNIVDGYIEDDITVYNDHSSLELRQGDVVEVAWFQEDYFIIFDENQEKFNVPKEYISIFKEVEEVTEEPVAPVLETAVAPASLSQSASVTATNIINKAETLIGAPYVYGDTGKAGYDCSGMVYALYGEFTDIKLPRTSRDMANVGTYVTESELEPGDLLFFNNYGTSTIGHVALYIGDGMMIHASNSQASIVKDPIDGYYFNNNFSHGRRVLD